MTGGGGDFGAARPSNGDAFRTEEDGDLNGSQIDPERLGALLEGQVTGRERAELLARMAAHDESLEIFADALAVTDELEREDAQRIDAEHPVNASAETSEQASAVAPEEVRAIPVATAPAMAEDARVIPFRAPERRRAWLAGPRLALAATVAAVAIGVTAWGLSRRGADSGDPGRYAASLARPGLPAGWDAAPWTAVRAPDATLDPRTRAVRLGARLTDLQAAAEAGDAVGTGQAAADVRVLLDPLPAAGPAVAIYREVEGRAGESADALEPVLARGRQSAARLAGEEAVALGAWAEAARLAAARRDAAFFRARATRDALDRATRIDGLPTPAREALGRLRASSDPPDWAVLQRDATALLAAAGG